MRGTRVTVAAASHLTTVAELREAVCDAYLAVCCRATTKLQAHWRGCQVRSAIKEHMASALPDPSPSAQYGGGDQKSGRKIGDYDKLMFIRIAFENGGVRWQSRDYPAFDKLIPTGSKDSNRSTILNRELKKWLKLTDTTGPDTANAEGIPTFSMRHARRLPLTAPCRTCQEQPSLLHEQNGLLLDMRPYDDAELTQQAWQLLADGMPTLDAVDAVPEAVALQAGRLAWTKLKAT